MATLFSVNVGIHSFTQMKNSEIIENLIYKLKNIPEKELDLIIDEDLENPDLLKVLDSNGLDYIIVGDNPGNTEKKNNRYFYETGQAGKHARTFVKLMELIELKRDKKIKILFLNKTLFHSPRTHLLEIKQSVLTSFNIMIDALNNFIISNENLNILIVGYSKSDLNKGFFPQLQHLGSSNLLEHTHFSKHFSNGHFMEQFVSSINVQLENTSEIDFHTILKTMHNETL